jgi:4'-phosphopantetheinyl transferase EntD
MISALVPAPVVAFEEFGDVPHEARFPGEEKLVANAVEVRRTEFITARRCARRALAALGHAPAPLRPGPHREPLRPSGFAGSITHCAGYRAAAVARLAEPASTPSRTPPCRTAWRRR